jgi:cell division protein FtsB
VALLIVGGIASLFVTGRATSELQLSRKRVASLSADIRQLEKENSRLRAEIDSVKKSTYAVERIARMDLGMSRKGEVIYLLPSEAR